MRFSSIIAGAAASMFGPVLSTIDIRNPGVPADIKPGRPTIYIRSPWRWASIRGRFYPHVGGSKQERERRMRQIAAGSLRVENGLVA